MRLTQRVKKILANYAYAPPGVQLNLARLLMHGKLGGTGKMIIYPIDQGFEHGPGRSFSTNPRAYDPLYHFTLASEADVSGFAAPLGFLQTGCLPFLGRLPLILKINSGTTLAPGGPRADQAITASVDEAVRLGCCGIGFTIYPGVDGTYNQFEELKDLAALAQDRGLIVVVWSYPRGMPAPKDQQALDVVAYGAHMACLLGATIVKVKLPTQTVSQLVDPGAYATIPKETLTDRVRHVVQSCFDGRRLVIFSGGQKQTPEAIYQDVKAICDGGGGGSIIGRNCFQRPYDEALSLLTTMISIYKNSATRRP